MSLILKRPCRSGLTAAVVLLVLFGALDRVSKPLSIPGSIGVLHAKDGHSGGDGGGRGGGDRDGGDDGGRGKDGRDDSSDRDDRGEDRSGRREDDDRREAGSVSRFMDKLAKRGEVVWSRVGSGSVSVRYADGWTESVERGRYSLRDKNRRTVSDRAAKPGDVARLTAVAKAR
jgi:hypothetical protein